jgi:hypothetical protein
MVCTKGRSALRLSGLPGTRGNIGVQRRCDLLAEQEYRHCVGNGA